MSLSSILGLKKERTKDIELPNESGMIDPRLKKPPSLRESLGKMKKGLKIIKDKKLFEKKDNDD